MKRITFVATALVLVSTFSLNAHAACPKETTFKLREHRIKAEESLFKAYDFLQTLDHVSKGLALAKGECASGDYVFRMNVLAGAAYYYKRDRKGAHDAFMRALQAKDADLPKDLSAPALLRFYESVRAEFHSKVAAKKAKEEQIRRLQATTGMPPEPEESPKMPIEHNPRAEGFRGRDFLIYCRLSDMILSRAAKVLAYVDTAGDGTYKEFPMQKMGKRRFVLMLKGNNTKVPQLKYYIMAFDAQGKPLAASGNSGMPHTVPMQIPQESAESPEDEATASDSGKKSENSAAAPAKTDRTPAAKDGKKEKKPAKVKQVMEEEEPSDLEDVPAVFKKPKKEKAAWDAGSVPLMRFGLRLGTGLGWISGHTEVYKTALNSGIALAPIQVGFTVAGMLSRHWSIGVDFDFGMIPTESDLYDTAADMGVDNDGFVTTSMRSDMRILLKVRKFSTPQDYSRSIRWRWYWEAGFGGGRMRHMAPGEDSSGKSVADTDYTSGFMLGAGAGAVLCLTDSCNFSVLGGANYTAAYSMDPDNTSLLHLDFFLGAEYMF